MVRNTPDNVNNLMQFCCILARTDTEAVAVRYENLPEDCAYGINIFDSDGKRKAFAGFWKNGSLNRVFLPEPGIQAGCFLSLAVDLDVCAFDETFGKAPVLEIWQRNRSRRNNIASFGNILGKWIRIDEPDYGNYVTTANRFYAAVTAAGAGGKDLELFVETEEDHEK